MRDAYSQYRAIYGICSGISAAKGYARKFNQCSKNSEEIKSYTKQAVSHAGYQSGYLPLEKELLVKNREDKLGNVVVVSSAEELRQPLTPVS
ncbi:hypothetical protein TNCV_3882491 [Trichonephila clavipes]|nr:hypothetical protein TNCV_3882491 [Trichonephila clavipes]